MEKVMKTALTLLAPALLLASPATRADDPMPATAVRAESPLAVTSPTPPPSATDPLADVPTELPAPTTSSTGNPSPATSYTGNPSPAKLVQAETPLPQPVAQGAGFATLDGAMFRDVAPGISRSPVWGDDTRGSYGAYTRFGPGADNGQHTHSSDIRIVVLGGTYLYQDATGRRSVGAGDVIRIPGGLQHWSGGDAREGALFYEEATGKFDMTPVIR
jgi:hypothetical protein